ncbi:MAG TPA: carboxypeptidase regulatory-like domain-containing protein [Longimicrobium sp.]
MNASRWHIIACAAALSLAAVPAHAQRVTVTGQVTDGTGEPIPGAIVKVGDEEHVAVTDAQGNFAVRGVRPGERTVWANALGYAMSAGTVTVTETGAPGVDLVLDRAPILLEGITATVNRFEARRRAYAHSARVMNEGEIATSGAANMREFVEARAGLYRVACGGSRGGGLNCVNIRGRPSQPVVYVDEVRWLGGLDILSYYRPADVARVEVYSGGQQVRVYTRWFMEWAAQHNYQPWPILISGY